MITLGLADGLSAPFKAAAGASSRAASSERLCFMVSLLGDLRLLLRCSSGLGRVAFHFNIILLGRAWRAAAGGDELLQQCFHLGDFLRHCSGEVLGFTEVV